MHTIYKIEKTQLAVATQRTGSSHTHVNIPESPRSRSRSGGKMKKFGKWLKAIFEKCTYVADRAYETQLEQRQQHGHDLPPLPPIPPPPQYDLSSLSNTDSDDEDDDDDEEEEQG